MNASITTNAADVTLAGVGSTFTAINPLTSNAGSFAVLASRDFNTVSGLGNTGRLVVGVGSDIKVNGALTLGDAAALVTELFDADTAEGYGQINVTGVAQLDGSLELETTSPYVPVPTATFSVLTYASRAGRFTSIAAEPIAPGQTFSVHYDDHRVLAIAGEWASPDNITGEFDVPGGSLLISDDWHWSGLVVKHGAGDLLLDLTGDFSTDNASLAIVDGTVRLMPDAVRALVLGGLTFGDLGQLTGDTALSGQWGVYVANVSAAVPEPTTGLCSMMAAAFALLLGRRQVPERGDTAS